MADIDNGEGASALDQWKIIDNAMSEMIAWTENTPIPAAKPVKHRKSEPNPAKITESLNIINDSSIPQSAPVQPGFKPVFPEPLMHNKGSNGKLSTRSSSKSGSKSSIDNLTDAEETSINPTSHLVNNHANIGLRLPTYGSSPAMNDHSTLDSEHKRFPTRSDHQSAIHHQTSSPALIGNNSMHKMPDISETLVTSNLHSYQKYPRPDLPSSNRRQSAPSGNTRLNSPKVTKRSTSYPHHGSTIHKAKSFDSKPSVMEPNITALDNLSIHNNPLDYSNRSNGYTIHESSEQSNSIESYNDSEYTKALLQHQCDRKKRLQNELDKDKIILGSLQHRVKIMEQRLLERRQQQGTASSSIRVTLEDIGKIRNINRQLEIDCNCMNKELELIKKNSGLSGQNFYETITSRNPSQSNTSRPRRQSRIPVGELPPPPPPPEEETWRCKHCTFDNHTALNKCEICEHARTKL